MCIHLKCKTIPAVFTLIKKKRYCETNAINELGYYSI